MRGVGDRRADVRADELGRQQQPGPALDELALDGRRCSRRPRPGRCARGCRGRPGPRRTRTTRSPARDAGRAARRAAGRRRRSARARRRRPSWSRPPRAGRGCGPTSGRRSRSRRPGPRSARAGRRTRRDEPRRAPAARARRGPPARQHPVGVGADDVGVGVDHLRLDPQTELHAQAAHPVGQRPQALAARRRWRRTSRPGRWCRRGGRRTSRRRARSARHRCAAACSASAVSCSRDVVEVHGLPRVEHQRPGAAGMTGPCPQPAVDPPRTRRRARRRVYAKTTQGVV